MYIYIYMYTRCIGTGADATTASQHQPPPNPATTAMTALAPTCCRCYLEDGLGVAFQMIGMKPDAPAQMDPPFKSSGFMRSFC